jgi:hypothetical protein
MRQIQKGTQITLKDGEKTAEYLVLDTSGGLFTLRHLGTGEETRVDALYIARRWIAPSGGRR